jgi:hypothetical protein
MLAMNRYQVKLTLIRDMLATNPCDPNILDQHIINRQRELILDQSKINKEVNKYLDQIDISKDKGEAEINRLLDGLEKLTGYTFTQQDRELAVAGELTKLKETFKELKMAGTTIFFWDKKTDKPCIGDHMVYGFLKAAAEAIGRTKEKKAGKVMHSTAYTQSLINQHVRCEDQFITFDKDIQRGEDGKPQYLQRSLRAMTAMGPRITLAKSEVMPAGATLKFTLKVMEQSDITKKVLEELFSYGEMSGLGQWRNAGHGMFITEIMQQN